MRTLITVETDKDRAPGCFLICRVTGKPGSYEWDKTDEANTVLVQSDHDFPGLASNFGFDYHDDKIEASIALATEFLDNRVCDCPDDSRVIEDPGYFPDQMTDSKHTPGRKQFNYSKCAVVDSEWSLTLFERKKRAEYYKQAIAKAKGE